MSGGSRRRSWSWLAVVPLLFACLPVLLLLAGGMVAMGCYPIGGCDPFTYPVGRATVEEFSKVRLPPSADELRARFILGRDSSLEATFVIDRIELGQFIRDARFSQRVRSGRSWLGRWATFDERLDRQLAHARRVLSAEEGPERFPARAVAVELDHPAKAVVHLRASEF